MPILSIPRLAPANVAPVPTETPWTLEALGEPWLAFAVHGIPAPQGSKKSVGVRKKGPRQGQPILVESSKKVDPWRRRVAQVAKLATGYPDQWPPLNGALVCDMVFTLPRPKSFPSGDLRRVHGMPTAYPDLSKLLRSTEDALTKIVWADDARVVAYRRDAKVYVGSGDPDALREPGAVIRVWSVGP